MSKWDDLKRLAESQPEKEWRFHFQSFSYMTKQKMFSVSGPEGVSDYENWGYTLDAAKYIAAANPAAVLELIAENERLRQIIINSAKEVGAALSTECSLEFMERLPQEIWLVMQRQQDGADQLIAELAKLRTLSGGKR
ncbi:hypothetical protein [Pseudomonas luteola]|uniref:hypothetical protein n=1 Tax=Pseudomonas luteola TaxID=47886 RepID=UPI0015E3145F|nr:hypothetical protein [Pseudomonas zeshuii]MBA1249874.1 hypothetical protein [Pseudomonas zeshuii]